MTKYICKICKYIYDEKQAKIDFNDLNNEWCCPMCTAPKSLFEENTSDDIDIFVDETPANAVKISKDNIAIERDISKCIKCGICKNTCKVKEGMTFDSNSELCVNCGQCIQTCPVNSLKPKNDISKLEQILSNKILVAYTSPAIRVAIGEAFGKEYGTFEQRKLVGLLKQIGFKYVFDTTFGADLTIMEEASELIDRIKNDKKLPMFTSCCPAWVKYAEQFYPELIENISTCKSPIGMQGIIVKEYFAPNENLNPDDIYTVAITPCTAKKYEINRDEIDGTDLVITVLELIDYIKSKNISYDDIEEGDYDSFFKGSGAGMIFGNTGGVMEAALRTSYHLMTGKELEKLEFSDIRGLDNVKETSIDIDGTVINVAVIQQMSSAKEILEDVKNGTSKYHYIEIMNCLGGCVGGGGLPKISIDKELEVKEKRIEALYKYDNSLDTRCSHNNPEIKKIYDDFLEYPLGLKSRKLLHTSYKNKSDLVDKTLETIH